MPKLPTASVQLIEGPREVPFGIGRLVKIEKALGKTANVILLDDLAVLAPPEPFDPDQDKDAEAGGAAGNAAVLEHYREAARKIGVEYMAQFVAASLDVQVEQLDAFLEPGQLRPAFIALATVFVEAVGLLNGAAEPPAPDPQTPAATG